MVVVVVQEGVRQEMAVAEEEVAVFVETQQASPEDATAMGT
jgi:hypothetical protein